MTKNKKRKEEEEERKNKINYNNLFYFYFIVLNDHFNFINIRFGFRLFGVLICFSLNKKEIKIDSIYYIYLLIRANNL